MPADLFSQHTDELRRNSASDFSAEGIGVFGGTASAAPFFRKRCGRRSPCRKPPRDRRRCLETAWDLVADVNRSSSMPTTMSAFIALPTSVNFCQVFSSVHCETSCSSTNWIFRTFSQQHANLSRQIARDRRVGKLQLDHGAANHHHTLALQIFEIGRRIVGIQVVHHQRQPAAAGRAISAEEATQWPAAKSARLLPAN